MEKPLEFFKLLIEMGVLVCVTVAFNKCSKEMKLQTRKDTLVEIYKIKDKGFLETQARLKNIAKGLGNGKTSVDMLTWTYSVNDFDRAQVRFFDDVNLVFNTYENIATFYVNDLVEKDIIDNTICDEILEFSSYYGTLKQAFFPNDTLHEKNLERLKSRCIH